MAIGAVLYTQILSPSIQVQLNPARGLRCADAQRARGVLPMDPSVLIDPQVAFLPSSTRNLIYALARLMIDKWPVIFEGAPVRPLAVGAGRQIAHVLCRPPRSPRLGKASPQEIVAVLDGVLTLWCLHPLYLVSCQPGRPRYGLDGCIWPCHRGASGAGPRAFQGELPASLQGVDARSAA
jgi:hypothetical protein